MKLVSPLIFTFMCLFLVEGFNLLLIGDSFDRFFCNEWCSDKPSTHHLYTEKNQTHLNPAFELDYGIVWGHQNLTLDKHRPPLFCRDNILDDSLATFFIYGSNLTHPYYHNYNEIHDDTGLRVTLGLKSYFELIDSLPDRIIVSTTQWDASYFSTIEPLVKRGDIRYNDFLLHRQQDMHILLDLIIEIVGNEIQWRCLSDRQTQRRLMSIRTKLSDRQKLNKKDTQQRNKQPFDRKSTDARKSSQFSVIKSECGLFVDIGLRSTTTRNKFTTSGLLHDMNKIMHNITIQRNLTWYDLESDVLSVADYREESSLFRDWLHPMHAFSSPTINKLMGRQYTQFLSHQGGTQRLSHIITNETQLNSDAYKHVNFRLIRAIAGSGHKKRRSKHGQYNKNKQIVHIQNSTNVVHSIPGFGPIYYSTFINGSRVKWFIGDISADFHMQLKQHRQESLITKPQNSSSTLYQLNTQYERAIKTHLRQLIFSTSDLVLLSDDLLSLTPTQGVMPILFNSTAPTAFTVRNDTNINGMHLFVAMPYENTPRIISDSMFSTFMTFITRNNNITLHQNIDPFWLPTTMQPIRNSNFTQLSSYFQNNTLIRHKQEPSIQVVLNLTRHYFTGRKSFVARGYKFSDVLLYDHKQAVYIDFMSVGESLK